VLFEVQSHNRHPKNSTQWESLILTRKMLKELQTFKPGTMFGQSEAMSNSYRKTQVKALSKGKLYFMTWSTYFECSYINEY